MKVVLLEVSFLKLHSSDNQGDQMEGESGFTGSIIDELHSRVSQGDKMEC